MDFPKEKDMNKEERKKFDENIAEVFCRRAKAAKSGDNASMTIIAWS